MIRINLIKHEVFGREVGIREWLQWHDAAEDLVIGLAIGTTIAVVFFIGVITVTVVG